MITTTQDRQRAIAIDADLTPAEICEVFEAVILAWPAEHHRLVMALGNRLCGMAREAALGFSEYGNYGENNPPLP